LITLIAQVMQHLPEIIRRMRELEKQVEQLRAKSA